jgi:hypothetical protein
LQKAIDEQQKKIQSAKGTTPDADAAADAQDYQLQRADDVIRGIARYTTDIKQQ